jgi:hypothetical protein
MRSVGALLWLCVAMPGASAFAPAQLLSKTSLKAQAPSTRIAAFMPEHVDTMNSAFDQLHQFSSLILSDASAAVDADAATDGGLWSSYLGLFKAFLTFIHSTIDQPLRDHGITQTWGVSIALFTASKLDTRRKRRHDIYRNFVMESSTLTSFSLPPPCKSCVRY